MLNNKKLEEIGFEPVQHFTVGDNMIYKLPRYRQISISSAGTPNEIMVLNDINEDNPNIIENIIVLHNYDYDGYLSESKLINLINWFNNV
jgi:hypothetical protein